MYLTFNVLVISCLHLPKAVLQEQYVDFARKS